MNLFEKVKGHATIADVVGSYGVQLNASNKGFCPFHNEKTPSFSVKTDDNTWKCFGCGEGGDAIDFVAKIKEIEPIEAARLLAEQYRIDIEVPKPKKPAPKKQKSDIKKYLEQCADNISQTDYFIRRGITDETVKKYKLGYDPKQKRVTIPYSSKLDYYCARRLKPTTRTHLLKAKAGQRCLIQ